MSKNRRIKNHHKKTETPRAKNIYTRGSPPPNHPIVLIIPHKVLEYLNSPIYKSYEAEWDAWLKAQGFNYAQRQYEHMQARRYFIEKAQRMIGGEK